MYWRTEHVEIEIKKKVESPVVIMAFSTPGKSLAPIMAGGIFADKLKMERIGMIDSDLLPPVMGVMNGEIQFPVAIYHYGENESNEIVVIMGPAPMPNHSYQFCKDLMDWVKSLNPKEIALLSTAHADELKVFGAATTKDVLNKFKDLAQIEPVTAGALTWHDAQIMAESIKREISGMVVMAVEILLEEQKQSVIDPKEVALTLLETLNKVYLEGKTDFQQAVEQINALQAPAPAVAAASQAANSNRGYA